MPQKYYKINRQITAPTLRLLDEDGKQINVVSLAEAIQLSQESGLDLVEVASSAVPPVVKLIEYSKFKYQEAKKAKAEKKGIKGGETKEVQMTPFIGQGDYDTRIKKSREFLTTGNKVKLSIKFQGRQIQKPEFGYQLVDRFKNDLAEISAPEGTAKLIGKRLLITFTPVKKIKN
ncbi:MAG: translation initiation factor IF-3 [Candidatus Shapirobacteria bacterium]|jgi:translation initiation factor IF-3